MKFYAAFVKGHVIFDLFGLVFGLRIIPGCIMLDVFTDDDVVITGLAFPGAGGEFVAFLEILLFNGFRWKIMVAFNDNRLIAFCQSQIIAYNFHCLFLLDCLLFYRLTGTSFKI